MHYCGQSPVGSPEAQLSASVDRRGFRRFAQSAVMETTGGAIDAVMEMASDQQAELERRLYAAGRGERPLIRAV